MRKIIVVPLVVIAVSVFAIVCMGTGIAEEGESLPAYDREVVDGGIAPGQPCKCTYIVEKKFNMGCNWQAAAGVYECGIDTAGFDWQTFNVASAKCNGNDKEIGGGYFINEAKTHKSVSLGYKLSSTSVNKKVVSYTACIQY